MGVPTVRAVLPIALLAVLLAGCGEGTDPIEVNTPESPDDGIQATGTLDGSRVAISRGNPIVVLGDCDANDGLDTDLCIAARTIDGLDVSLVVENPAALVPGETLEVRDDPCTTDCDGITEFAVVELRTAGDQRRVERGTLEVRDAGPRFVADFDLTLRGGDRLIGVFDVEETPPE